MNIKNSKRKKKKLNKKKKKLNEAMAGVVS